MSQGDMKFLTMCVSFKKPISDTLHACQNDADNEDWPSLIGHGQELMELCETVKALEQQLQDLTQAVQGLQSQWRTWINLCHGAGSNFASGGQNILNNNPGPATINISNAIAIPVLNKNICGRRLNFLIFRNNFISLST
jgi:hypothetical protein